MAWTGKQNRQFRIRAVELKDILSAQISIPTDLIYKVYSHEGNLYVYLKEEDLGGTTWVQTRERHYIRPFSEIQTWLAGQIGGGVQPAQIIKVAYRSGDTSWVSVWIAEEDI